MKNRRSKLMVVLVTWVLLLGLVLGAAAPSMVARSQPGPCVYASSSYVFDGGGSNGG